MQEHFPADPEARGFLLAEWIKIKEIPFSEILNEELNDREMTALTSHLQYVNCNGFAELPSALLSSFTNAHTLINVRSNDLTDLSSLSPKLQQLGIQKCPQLQAIDFSHFPQLQAVMIQNCPVTSLDLSNQEHLEKVAFSNLPHVTTINVANDDKIKE